MTTTTALILLAVILIAAILIKITVGDKWALIFALASVAVLLLKHLF